MFFEGDRIAAVREMILADDEKGRRTALAKIQPMQRQDFVELFEIMAGLPVTIRLLDPPLHEFLPQDRRPTWSSVAKDHRRRRWPRSRRAPTSCTSSTRCSAIAACGSASPIPRSTRCRPAPSSRPWPRSRRRHGKTVIPEIMIPLVATRKELDLMKAVIDQVAAEVSQLSGAKLRVSGRHHDRAAARRLARRRDRRDRPSSSASAPTT